MAQSNEQGMNPIKSEDELEKRVQDICDRVHAGMLPPKGVKAIMNLITTLQRQHERELDDAKLIIAAIVHQEQGELLVGNAHFVDTARGLVFEKNPPGKDGIVIRLTTNQEGEKHE